MKVITNSILLVGMGNLGRRHLQGIVRCRTALRITLLDINKYSLQQALEDLPPTEKWGANHVIILCDRVEDCPKEVTILIDATTANDRGTRLNGIVLRTNPRFAIIEKVLSQSIEESETLLKSLSKTQDSWVNYARRSMGWHCDVKNEMCGKGPLKIIHSGSNWGLLCNSLHFIDMVEWWTQYKVKQVVLEDIEWVDAKRIGFIEAHGCVEVQFYGDHAMTIYDRNIFDTMQCKIKTSADETYLLNESSGYLMRNNSVIINGRNDYQSELTNHIVEDILEGEKCNLPLLNQSILTHNIFISAILKKINSNSNGILINKVNIT
jgi:hypothetical protein